MRNFWASLPVETKGYEVRTLASQESLCLLLLFVAASVVVVVAAVVFVVVVFIVVVEALKMAEEDLSYLYFTKLIILLSELISDGEFNFF